MICNKCNNEGVAVTILNKTSYYCRTCKDDIKLEQVNDPFQTCDPGCKDCEAPPVSIVNAFTVSELILSNKSVGCVHNCTSPIITTPHNIMKECLDCKQIWWEKK